MQMTSGRYDTGSNLNGLPNKLFTWVIEFMKAGHSVWVPSVGKLAPSMAEPSMGGIEPDLQGKMLDLKQRRFLSLGGATYRSTWRIAHVMYLNPQTTSLKMGYCPESLGFNGTLEWSTASRFAAIYSSCPRRRCSRNLKKPRWSEKSSLRYISHGTLGSCGFGVSPAAAELCAAGGRPGFAPGGISGIGLKVNKP